MQNKRFALVFGLFLNFLCALPLVGFAGDGNEEGDSPGFLQQRTDRYTLLEDDFDDIPRRPTRYDYLKEDAEPLRLFSRPAGSEFAIFNLQWRHGSVFINNLTVVPGTLKKPKWLAPDGTGRFFYRLFSDQNLLLREAPLDIYPVLHFDTVAGSDGELAGGALARSEFDFILKIPLPEKTARTISFYRDLRGAGLRQRTVEERDTEHAVQIGGAEF